MRFLKISLRGISGRSTATLMLLCALVLSVCVTSYARTQTPISNQAKSSPTNFYGKWNPLSDRAGQASAPDKRSIERLKLSTNFTDLKTFRFSEKRVRSNFGSADRIRSQSNLSANSIIFTSRNLPTTRANRCGSFSSRDISKTERLCSDANQLKNSKIFAKLPETNLKTLRIAKQKRLSKPPRSAFGIGRTSAVSVRQRSNWRVSSPRWTRGQPNFAAS